jgi:membrane protease YdiL (CAAX protease family)
VSINEPTSPEQLLIETFPDVTHQPVSPAEPLPINPDDPPWGIPLAMLVWVISVLLLILVQLIVTVPYVVYKALTHGSMEALGTDPNLIFIAILSVFPTHALTFLVVWFVVTNRGRRPFWSTLGWHWPKNFRPWITIGLAVVLLALGSLVTWLIGGNETQLDLIINSSLKTRFATAILAAVTGPLVEELVYRGVLYPALQKALGAIAAVAIVSLLFVTVHVPQYYSNFGVLAVILLLSVSLTLVRARSRSLLPSYVMHLVFNGIQAVILIVQPFVGKPAENKAVTGFLIQTISRLLT